jgi:hypothetical protein
MSGSSADIRPTQPSSLSQNHPDHPKLADLGLKEEHCKSEDNEHFDYFPFLPLPYEYPIIHVLLWHLEIWFDHSVMDHTVSASLFIPPFARS